METARSAVAIRRNAIAVVSFERSVGGVGAWNLERKSLRREESCCGGGGECCVAAR